jgi:hypothetical protein
MKRIVIVSEESARKNTPGNHHRDEERRDLRKLTVMYDAS